MVTSKVALTPDRPEISVAIPTFNEEDNVVQITEAVIAELQRVTEHFEVVLIDNASTDRTVPLIRGLVERFPMVRGIVNARNFGQMRSPTHAIYCCRGQAVIGMCADFQDPPHLIGDFVKHWRAGSRIVLGVRRAEPAARWLAGLREFAYWMVGRLGDVQPIRHATGFGLYDARVLDILRQWNDPEPFFRAMLVESGQPITTIGFDRPARTRGESKNNLRSLMAFALSALPLISRNVFRLCFGLGLVLMTVGAVLAVVGLVATPWSAQGSAYGLGGLATTAIGVIVALLSVLGIQLITVADRVRNVPLVIERERINFSAPPPSAVPDDQRGAQRPA